MTMHLKCNTCRVELRMPGELAEWLATDAPLGDVNYIRCGKCQTVLKIWLDAKETIESTPATSSDVRSYNRSSSVFREFIASVFMVTATGMAWFIFTEPLKLWILIMAGFLSILFAGLGLLIFAAKVEESIAIAEPVNGSSSS